MLAIINRKEKFGTLNGVYKLNSEILSLVNKAIKEGKADLHVDNDETLMYKIKNGQNGLQHPIRIRNNTENKTGRQ